MEKEALKAVSNEQIIAALMQHGTVKEAAAAVGISPRTVYDRMNTATFQSAYYNAKNDIIRAAVFSINEKLGAAVEAVAEIMQDPETNPAVRLQAAQTILNNAGKFAERLRSDEYQSRAVLESPAFANSTEPIFTETTFTTL